GAALWGGFGGYPPANLGRALAAAVERGGKHVVPLGPQPLGNEFPDPPALIGAVNEYEVGHDFLPYCRRFRRLALQCGSEPARHIDGETGDEIGMRGGQEADDIGLVS